MKAAQPNGYEFYVKRTTEKNVNITLMEKCCFLCMIRLAEHA